MGAMVADALSFKCRTRGCNEQRMVPSSFLSIDGKVIGSDSEECEYCKDCAAKRVKDAVNGDSDDSGLDDFDTDRPLGNTRGL